MHFMHSAEAAMDFVVTLKGFACFLGKFTDVCAFVRSHWGSMEAAADSGVRVMPADRYRLQ